MKRRKYQAEAWRGLDCIDVSVRTQPVALRKVTDHQIVDLGADRVYVRAIGPDVHGLMATFEGGFWKRIDDPNLSVLEGDLP